MHVTFAGLSMIVSLLGAGCAAAPAPSSPPPAAPVAPAPAASPAVVPTCEKRCESIRRWRYGLEDGHVLDCDDPLFFADYIAERDRVQRECSCDENDRATAEQLRRRQCGR